MELLNLGCGARVHNEWINLDFVSQSKSVIECNLVNGIPFEDNRFDMVYSSHLLEHFQKTEARKFIGECYRVLKPNGIIRIAVPDLERIANIYIKALIEIDKGNKEWECNYDWILLEMYDQAVRNISGGEMKKYLCQDNIINEGFVIKRCGIEVKKIIENEKGKVYKTIKQEMKRKNKGLGIKRRLMTLFKFIFDKKDRKEIILKNILKDEYKALEIGRFRLSGEVHQWMYDRFSLTRLLETYNFKTIMQRGASESFLENWSLFNLDTEANGDQYKPDSLYIEGIK